MADCELHITVNGETRSLREGLRVQELLAELGLSSAPCAVEVNRRLIPKAQHPDHQLRPGDHVELVTLVGGG